MASGKVMFNEDEGFLAWVRYQQARIETGAVYTGEVINEHTREEYACLSPADRQAWALMFNMLCADYDNRSRV